MRLIDKLYIGGTILVCGGLAFCGVETMRGREAMKTELRYVHGRLAEAESEAYCNAKWIEDLQEDNEAKQDRINELETQIADLQDVLSKQDTQIKTLAKVAKMLEIGSKAERQVNVQSNAENVISDNSGTLNGVLTATGGVNYYGDQKETWYNLPMEAVVEQARNFGFYGEYWEREDGCKMYGDYIILACNRDVHPMGSLVETSLGTGISLDTGPFASANPTQVDIAVNWKE